MSLFFLTLAVLAVCIFLFGWCLASIYHLTRFQEKWNWAAEESQRLDRELKEILRRAGLDV